MRFNPVLLVARGLRSRLRRHDLLDLLYLDRLRNLGSLLRRQLVRAQDVPNYRLHDARSLLFAWRKHVVDICKFGSFTVTYSAPTVIVSRSGLCFGRISTLDPILLVTNRIGSGLDGNNYFRDFLEWNL